jgi:hypothetical protein
MLEVIMTSDFQKRQADWAKKEQAKEDEERKDEVKVGEVSGKAKGDIGHTDEVKIRIDHVETLRLKPSFNYIKDDSIKIIIMADRTAKAHEKQRWGRERIVQAGEAVGKVTGHIKKSDNVKIRIDNIETLTFSSSEELKKGDSLRVIVEKL